MKANNPFTLTFGKKPNEYIARYEATDMILSTFTAANPVNQAYMIEGLRGSGKTVLMTAIASTLRQDSNWVVVDLNSTRDLIEDLALRLSDSCRKLPNLLEVGFNVTIAGVGLGINGTHALRDNISLIEELLEALEKKSKKVLITIDEVLGDENMRRFASEYQIFLRKNYPVFLLMTGLYENIHQIQNDPALTFLLRTPKISLGPLSIHQITKQYQTVFDISREEARNRARITKGYAFAFQALGMLYFEYGDTLTDGEILSKMEDMLDDFVYAKIWSTLSGREKEIMKVMTDEQIKVKTICDKLGITSSSFSQYRERLIKKGLLVPSGHGFLELTLPRFAEVIQSYT